MSLYCGCDFWMAGLEYVINIKAWILPYISGSH